MDAVSSRLQKPSPKLLVSVPQGSELAKGHEAVFNVLYPGLHPALLLGIVRRTRGDQEVVPFRKLCVGALNMRIIKTDLGDRALGVIDDELGGDPIEPLKGPAVTGQPGLHLLVGDDLRVHMPAEAKGHDKNPGFDHFTGKDVGDYRAFPKVHLGGASGGKIEDAGDLRVLASVVLLVPGGGPMSNFPESQIARPAHGESW